MAGEHSDDSSDGEGAYETNNLLSSGAAPGQGGHGSHGADRTDEHKREAKLRAQVRREARRERRRRTKQDGADDQAQDHVPGGGDASGRDKEASPPLPARSRLGRCWRQLLCALCALCAVVVLGFGVAELWDADPGQGSQVALRSWASHAHARDRAAAAVEGGGSSAVAPSAAPAQSPHDVMHDRWVQRVQLRTEDGLEAGWGWLRRWGAGLLQEGRPELWICFAFLVAGFVQGVAGFGCGMTSMAIIPARGTVSLVDTVPIVAVFNGIVCGLGLRVLFPDARL